jgi:hypothetical protein
MKMENPYPFNVLKIICKASAYGNGYDIPDYEKYEKLGSEKLDGIFDYILSQPYINDRERLIFNLRFRQGMSYKKIGEHLDISPHRVSQIAEYLLCARIKKYPRLKDFLEDSPAARKIWRYETDNDINSPLENFPLPTCTRSALKGYPAFFRTLGDLLNYSADEILSLSGVGINGLASIRDAIASIGGKVADYDEILSRRGFQKPQKPDKSIKNWEYI